MSKQNIVDSAKAILVESKRRSDLMHCQSGEFLTLSHYAQAVIDMAEALAFTNADRPVVMLDDLQKARAVLEKYGVGK